MPGAPNSVLAPSAFWRHLMSFLFGSGAAPCASNLSASSHRSSLMASNLLAIWRVQTYQELRQPTSDGLQPFPRAEVWKGEGTSGSCWTSQTYKNALVVLHFMEGFTLADHWSTVLHSFGSSKKECILTGIWSVFSWFWRLIFEEAAGDRLIGLGQDTGFGYVMFCDLMGFRVGFCTSRMVGDRSHTGCRVFFAVLSANSGPASVAGASLLVRSASLLGD